MCISLVEGHVECSAALAIAYGTGIFRCPSCIATQDDARPTAGASGIRMSSSRYLVRTESRLAYQAWPSSSVNVNQVS